MTTFRTATPLSLSCPRCGYDLSGQAAAWTDHCPLTGTCSECGLELDWITLHHPERLVPRWSIEHAPRLTPWVVLKSALRSLLPWKFWHALRMEHSIRPGRLVWVWLTLPPFLYLTCVVGTIVYAITPWGMKPWITALPSWMEFFFSIHILRIWGTNTRVAEPLVVLLLVTGTWTTLMPLTYFALSETMRKCRVRYLHLLRIAGYSLASWIVTCGTVLLVGFLIGSTEGVGVPAVLGLVTDAIVDYHPFLYLAWFIWFILYWWHATRTYLKLPHAVAIVALMTITAGLATLAVFVVPWLYF